MSLGSTARIASADSRRRDPSGPASLPCERVACRLSGPFEERQSPYLCRRTHNCRKDYGVPVVECRLLRRRSRVRRTSGCQYRRRGWHQQERGPAGAPGPRHATRLARARGSVYRPLRGTRCPPLLPPRRLLAKREQRRELSFTWLAALARWEGSRSFSFFSFAFLSLFRSNPPAPDLARDRYPIPALLPCRSARVLELLQRGWKVVR